MDAREQRRIELFEHAYGWFVDNLPEKPAKKWTVLEAGQGKYGWSDLYRQSFSQVYGVDIEDYSQFHPNVESLQHDLTKPLPLPDKSVDLVVSHSVLEHIIEVPDVLANLNKVLRVGGYVFITISPLYYSGAGSHVNTPVKLQSWEHLDPASECYMISNPLANSSTAGHCLNCMRFSDFMGWVGQLPWSIVKTKLAFDSRDIPDFVERDKWSETDLRLKGFFLLARKEYHCG